MCKSRMSKDIRLFNLHSEIIFADFKNFRFQISDFKFQKLI
jgi:hypothetical protein